MNDSEFKKAYARLNKEQKEAVDTIEGPVMVIAGPGTGKTTILTLRIANILQKTDTPASGILAITYTDAGVKAMRRKLLEIIGDKAHEVKICTFHSFASGIISEFPEHFPHLSRVKQITEVESDVTIRKILEDSKFRDLRPLGNPDLYIGSLIRGISECKHDAYTPESIIDYVKTEIERIKNDSESISTRGTSKGSLKADAKKAIEKSEKTILFAEVYKKYEDQKKTDLKIDYDDLIIELIIAWRKDELLLRLIQEKYLYIHVDEHQDTNDSQNIIISLLANFFETPNVFIVGDEKQAIYRFQGASVSNFLKFQDLWKGMKVISLRDNYRSNESILEASFAMIENNYEKDENLNLRIRLNSASGHQRKPIQIQTTANTSVLEATLVKQIKALSLVEPTASIAIIVRRNRDLDRILNIMEFEGVKVSSVRKIDIFSHPAGELFFDLINFFAEQSNIESFGKTIVAGLWGISFEKSVEYIRYLRGGHFAFAERELKIIAKLKKELLTLAPLSALICLAESSGYIKLIANEPSSIEVWRGIVALSESIIREGNIDSSITLFKHLLAYKTSSESKSVKVSVGVSDYHVKAMTAHGSKGLEFDYVFLPYASDESWIGKTKGSYFNLPKTHTGKDIKDERRLFYVALTRARKEVFILNALEESGGRELTELRFIDELHSAHIVRKEISDETSLNGLKLETVAETKNSQLLDFIKNSLLEKGLSVTALNHFLTCPSQFIFQSSLKLPQAPSASAEKGTIMHDAFSKVWKSEIRNKKTILSCINDSLLHFRGNTLLSKNDFETIRVEISENAPTVARALETHFASKGEIHSEEWSESIFTGKFENESINLKIHGKLDVIIDDGKVASVFDYKTKQAMSINAIKGETKSSDGNYFRQLVFYRILLEKDLKYKNRNISPALVFVSPDEKGRCPIISIPIEESDIKKVLAEIQSLIDSVWSGKILSDKCDDRKCEWCGLKKLTGNSF